MKKEKKVTGRRAIVKRPTKSGRRNDGFHRVVKVRIK